MSDDELTRIAGAKGQPDPNAPPPSWGQMKQQMGPAAVKQGGEWLNNTADFLGDLPNNPLGPRIIRGAKAVGGALYGAAKDELGSDLQYIRNLSPPEFRGSAPTYPGGEREHHPLLALTQGDTQPYNEAAKTDPALALTQGNTGPLEQWAKKGVFTGPLVGETGPFRKAMATAPLGVAADVLTTVGPTRAGRAAIEAGAAATAAAAGAPGAAVRAARRAVTRGFTPEPLNIEDARLVREYERIGGRLRPGQYSPSNLLRQGDSVLSDLPWPRATGFARDSEHAVLPSQQSEQFNRFLSHEIGEDAPRITDGVLTRADQRISDVYDEVLPRNQIKQSPALSGRIAQIENQLAEVIPDMDKADADQIGRVMARISNRLSGGGLTGEQYQFYRRRGGTLDEMASSKSPAVQQAGRDLRRALDEAFADQAQGTDGTRLRQARAQKRALETLRPLVDKAPTGNISPGLVLKRVTDEYGSAAEAGRLGMLGRVGNAYMKSQSNSGTTERGFWRTVLSKPLSAALSAGNAAVSLPLNATAARLANRFINAPDARQRLLARALEEEGLTATNIPPGANAQVLAQALRSRP